MATNRAPILALIAASAISQVGSMLTVVAVPWFVLQTTGSAAKTGLTGFFAALPFIVAGFLGGALVDRVGFKRMSIIGDITSGLAIALIPLLFHTVGLAFWALLALIFLSNLFNTPGNTARRSMAPDLTELAGMRLERANAAITAIPRFATLFGPPLAGVLIVALGPSNVLWFDAATFAFSAALIALAVPALPPDREAGDAQRGYRAALMEAWQFVRADRLVFALMTTFALTNFLDAPSSLLFAVYAERRFGSAVTLGLMFAAFGGGALAGSIIFGAVGHRARRWPLFLAWLIGSLLAYGLFALRPSPAPLLALLALWGLSLGSVNPLSATIYQERIPAALRGRVFGLMTSVGFLAIPIGRVVAGFTLDAFDMRWTFLGIAAGYVAIIAVVLPNRALRAMDAPGAASQPIAAPTSTPNPVR